MTDDELKALQKDVRKKKRIATEMASEVHDLVEDRLWTDYAQLVALSEKTAAACAEWAAANQKLTELS
ncbi:MAG: hypothetical protein MI864_00515 [Pseudomonadales bacterium]|nr:hypothetical protein [Pseudomonadales bacterium]